MNTNKLREALAEMEAERKVLDGGIESVRLVIARFEDKHNQSMALPTADAHDVVVQRTYIDDAVDVFRAVGEPIHMKLVVQRISALRGSEVGRASVESSFIRHIGKAANPRLAKFGKGVFGLAEWKEKPTLAHTA